MSHSWFYILYGVMLLGAAGLYSLMPRPQARRPSWAGVMVTIAIVGLAILGLRRMGDWDMRRFYFWLLAIPALWGAVRVVSHPRPVYSAVYLVLVVLAVAGELILADAEFLGAALVIIYAGAILVTYVFVIMLAQQHGPAEYDNRAREPLAAVIVASLLVAAIAQLLTEQPVAATQAASAAASGEPGNVRLVAGTLLTRYFVALEVAGVLLWAAIVGAIWLVHRRVTADEAAMPAGPGKPLGQIGREVPPF
ncbi:MAG: NADH-quinone oxidoreductase subunit J [Phycisphaerae bacterium]|nr:NADH-quinone oxidoreductase subunit J [Phycisphaerae bacterium]